MAWPQSRFTRTVINMKKLILLLVLLTTASYGADYHTPYDPGAVRKTDQALRLDTTNASISNNLDVAGNVGAATVNGVAPLTAAEKTQALVGSSTVNFSAALVTASNGFYQTGGAFKNASGTLEYASYVPTVASSSSVVINFYLPNDVGVFCELNATAQFTPTKQVAGTWHTIFHFTPSSSINGLVQAQSLDLDDSQLILPVWSWGGANTLRLTITNSHTDAIYNLVYHVKIYSRYVINITAP